MNNSVKLAFAAVGLVGSLTFNPGAETEYLEDDDLFSKTTSQLESGWEWGISSAQADPPERPIGGGERDPGGCGDCGNTEGDQDGDGYQEWLWYQECLESAQTAQERQNCERILD